VQKTEGERETQVSCGPSWRVKVISTALRSH